MKSLPLSISLSISTCAPSAKNNMGKIFYFKFYQNERKTIAKELSKTNRINEETNKGLTGEMRGGGHALYWRKMFFIDLEFKILN